MTRKDYVALAAALADTGRRDNEWVLYRTVVTNVANVLAADNPRFDRERFYKACGVED